MVVYPRSPESRQFMISFAQNWEDVLIDRVFHKPAGFYIDVGASNPIADSVTKYFSLAGWRGINIEPCVDVFAEIARDRPNDINLHCAVGRVRGNAPFHLLPDRGLSTMSEAQLSLLTANNRAGAQSMEVEVRTLADICAEFVNEEIDFLKIDAEGAEGDVIAGADWQRFRPRLLVIESTKPNSSELNCGAWEPELLLQGYSFQYFDGINRYYLRQEDAGLAAQLSAPVNVLDFCIPHRELLLRQELSACRQELQRLSLGPPPPPGFLIKLES